jgi:lauroyl/myristoyl acyltransferase
MRSKDNSKNYRTETIRSTALYANEFTAREEIVGRDKRSFGGARIKSIIMPKLHWLLLHTPVVIAMAPVRLTILLLRALYWWPQNPWRLSCEYICSIARPKGHTHLPRQVYQQLLTNLLGAAENFACLYGRGLDHALGQVQISSDDGAGMNQLVEEHGGVLLVVPHNFGTAFSTLKMNVTFPLLLIVRNPATIERTRVAIDFYERMQVKIIMVRGGNPFELSRTLFSVLKAGKTVAATVDSLDRSKNCVEVDMFATRIGFSPWAAKIAARMNIPIVPSYFRSRGSQISIAFGPHLVSQDVSELMQHYTRFFEQNIIEDPASWAFLADKNWHKTLRQINARLDVANSTTG